MAELGSFLTKAAAEVVSKPNTRTVDVSLINETIKVLLAARHYPPGTDVELPIESLLAIASIAGQIFLKQPMLLEIAGPINIVGDIHGQFSDLLRIFEVCGFPPNKNYLFLGDYIDRGKNGIETLIILLCFKIKFPLSFFLLRGNHECSSLNRIYGFYDECKRRYSVKVWRAFVDCFNCMPIAAIVDNRILCVHGGISPELIHLSDVYQIQRPCEVPESGLMCDLLWADPEFGYDEWGPSQRGVSSSFGPIAVNNFLDKYKLDLLCRAHQVVEDGYEFMFDRQVVTIFSAPNYCGEFDNAGAVMIVNSDLVCSFKVIRPVSHKIKFPELFPDFVPDSQGGLHHKDLSEARDHIPSKEELSLHTYTEDESVSSEDITPQTTEDKMYG